MVQDSPRTDDVGGAGQGCIQEECRGGCKGEGDYEGCSRMGGKSLLLAVSSLEPEKRSSMDCGAYGRCQGTGEGAQGASPTRKSAGHDKP